MKKLILVLVLPLVGCGTPTVKVKGGTDNKVEIIGGLDVNLNLCQKYEAPELQEKCLDAMLTISAVLKELDEQDKAAKEAAGE